VTRTPKCTIYRANLIVRPSGNILVGAKYIVRRQVFKRLRIEQREAAAGL
jgi:hypothetical protein